MRCLTLSWNRGRGREGREKTKEGRKEGEEKKVGSFKITVEHLKYYRS